MSEHKENVTPEHNHRHRSKKKRSRRKFWKFVSKYKLQLLGVVVLVVLLVGLFVIVLTEPPLEDGQETLPTQQIQTNDPDIQVKVENITIQVTHFSDPLPLVEGAAQAWMNAPITADVAQILSAYRDSGKRLDIGAPVELKFDVLNLPKRTTVVAFRVDVADNDTFENAWSYDLAAKDRSVQIWNLKTAMTYHYRITVHLSDGTASGAFGSFRTAGGPRILNIGGIRNVRDMGGWSAEDGKILPQGLLYRGSAMDGKYTLTDEGRNELVLKLGVKTDMDLRAPDEGGAALGANVTHKNYGISSYESIFTDWGRGAVRQVFADLANPNNYPIYLHCSSGIERTGTVCYLLQTLLGVNEEDVVRDFEMSALMSDEVSRKALTDMVSHLKTYGGETRQENVENYLLDIGVTAQEIASIRRIWLG